MAYNPCRYGLVGSQHVNNKAPKHWLCILTNSSCFENVCSRLGAWWHSKPWCQLLQLDYTSRMRFLPFFGSQSVANPFDLGRYNLIVGWVGVTWVAFITVLFCLPIVYPVSSTTLNYTPVAIGGLFVLIMSSWLLSARKWFKGPQFYVDDSLHGIKDNHS